MLGLGQGFAEVDVMVVLNQNVTGSNWKSFMTTR